MQDENTTEMLQANLLDCGTMNSTDAWGAAEAIATSEGMKTKIGQTGTAWDSCRRPIDENNCTLDWEDTPSKEPSNDEILEYLERHRLQHFLTDAIMYIAQHFPPDPYEFLLNHIESMVMKHHSKTSTSLKNGRVSPENTVPVTPVHRPMSLTPERQKEVVQRAVTVLNNSELTKTSAEKLFLQFATEGKKVTEEDFGKLFASFEERWGFQPDDQKLLVEVLRRWRFRANATNGTRGMPLWPLQLEDFISAYPTLLRYVRDKYAPIGGMIHRALFVRESPGKLDDKYDVGWKLGRGAYGDVLLVTHKSTKEQRVCKRVERVKQKMPAEEIAGEIDVLRCLDHPHIVRIFEFFENEEHVEMIMEPVLGGTLGDLIRGLYYDAEGNAIAARPQALNETWLATALSQLFSTLTHAHEVLGVIHKDLKCDNVMLVGRPKLSAAMVLQEPVHIMLVDFGISEVFRSQNPMAEALGRQDNVGESQLSAMGGSRVLLRHRSSRVGGTPSYMSPEMFQGSFTEKCDIWSVGTIMFRLLTGELPYVADNLLMQAHAVCSPRRHPRWELLSKYGWSLGCRWFCQQLLSKDEGMRPGASEALMDDWLVETKKQHPKEDATEFERSSFQRQQLQSHLTHMALHCVTSQLSLSQLHHMNLRFKHYDSTGDGRLSHIEMRKVLEDVGVTDPRDVELIIESLDSDRSGSVEYSEFTAGCLDIASDGMKNQLKVVFDIFDLDHSGSISLNELRQVLTQGPNSETPASLRKSSNPGKSPLEMVCPANAGVLPDGKTVEEVMAELDKNNTGKVEYNEFEKYLLAEHQARGKQKDDVAPPEGV